MAHYRTGHSDRCLCERCEEPQPTATEADALRSQLRDLTEELEREKGQLASALRRAAEAEAALADVRTLDEAGAHVARECSMWRLYTPTMALWLPCHDATPDDARAKAAAWVKERRP